MGVFMATVELNMENLNSYIENSKIMLIDFWAPWCAPCKMFGPIFEKASEKYPDIVFAKCNTDEQRDVASVFGIMSIPTLAIFREKILVFKDAGALPESALESLISQVKELDMDDVRRQVEEQAKKSATSGQNS